MLIGMPPRSLTRATLWRMALRITGVSALAIGLGMLHLREVIAERTLEHLSHYIKERVAHEREPFALARDNLDILAALIRARYFALTLEQVEGRYAQISERRLDGSTRHKTAGFDTYADTGLWIGADTVLSPELQRRTVAVHEVLRETGRALTNRFCNVYAALPENVMAIYWPGMDWAGQAPATSALLADEYMAVTIPANNPSGEIAWTSTYLDATAGKWMVSAGLPILDHKQRLMCTIHQDVLIGELFDRTLNRGLDGTWSFLLRSDGRLIAHPQLMSRIEAEHGRLRAEDSGDPWLAAAARTVLAAPATATVLEHPQGGALLLHGYIPENDWHLITVYPTALLHEAANRAGWVLIAIGGLTLIIEISLMWLVLKRQIAVPLNGLIAATGRLARGDAGVQVPVERQDELGELARSFNVMADAVAQRGAALAEQVSAKDAALVEAQRANEAKSAFLAMVSHELRTPLNGIIGCVSLLDDDAPRPDQRPYLDIVRQCSGDLLALIDDLLDSTRMDLDHLPLEDEEIELRSIVHEVGDRVAKRARDKGLHLVIEAGDGRLAVRGDRMRLRQIVSNLLGNAVKFTDKGRVEIRISGQVGGQVRVSISDTGPGIARDLQQRLFTPFAIGDISLTRAHGGTGLGLSIAKRLAERMGGRIELDSTPGRGSTFTLVLPALDVSTGTINAITRQEPDHHRGSGRVLVVEDNPINRRILVQMLTKLGYETHAAEDGEEALGLLRDNHYRLLITDLHLPGQTGIEMVQRWRAGQPEAVMPVLVLTADARDDVRSDCDAAGITAVLTKPVTSEQLKAELTRILSG